MFPRTYITRDACFPSVIYVSLYDLGIFISITNISMYNYMNAAYLSKLMYEISLSLSCPSFKNLSFKNLSLCAYAHHSKISPSKISHYCAYAHELIICYRYWICNNKPLGTMTHLALNNPMQYMSIHCFSVSCLCF